MQSKLDQTEAQSGFSMKRHWLLIIILLFGLLILLRMGLGPWLLKMIVPLNGLEDIVWIVIFAVLIVRAGFSLPDLWKYGNKWREQQVTMKATIQPKLEFVQNYSFGKILERIAIAEFANRTATTAFFMQQTLDALMENHIATYKLWLKLKDRLPTRLDWEEIIPFKFWRVVRTVEELNEEFVRLEDALGILERIIGGEALEAARKEYAEVNDKGWSSSTM